MSVTDHHFRREDREVMWRRIARHIDAHPGDLAIALDNLDRWESLGRVHPGPIHEWRGRILAARESREHLRALIDFLEIPIELTPRLFANFRHSLDADEPSA
jgi:hypothetical protein